LSEFYPSLADDCAFPNLARLEFGAPLSAQMVRLLNDDAMYPRLQSLTVRDSESAEWLERGPMLERPLAELTLASSCRWSTAFAHLLRSPGLRSLQRLELDSGCADAVRLAVFGEQLRDKVAEYPDLRHLSLSRAAANRQSLLLLAQAPIWETLTSFAIGCHFGVTPDDWAEFFRAWQAPALRHLSVQTTAFQNKGGVAFARNRSLANLHVLQLGGSLSATAFKALLAAPALQNLRVLKLSGVGVKKEFEALTDRAVFPYARRIEIRERNLPPFVAEKLRTRPGVVIR
jgi:hypothetical protein